MKKSALASETMPTSTDGSPPSPGPEAANGQPLRRRRRRRRSLQAVFSYSSSSSASSPSPSYQRHLFLSSSSTSSIPFSWEHQPGIPKNPNPTRSNSKSKCRSPLPLPPPLSTKAPGSISTSADPFAAALAACSDDLRSPSSSDHPPTPAAIAGRFGLLDLYRSCKAACSVAEATIRIPRPGSLRLNREAEPERS